MRATGLGGEGAVYLSPSHRSDWPQNALNGPERRERVGYRKKDNRIAATMGLKKKPQQTSVIHQVLILPKPIPLMFGNRICKHSPLMP